ncbi:motility associated factor glycosyltransferase family protein [Campylobacter jejuni]|nr:motility associated factor glycosyltransferase family protein [Campylobacter jejuni]EEU7985142.1 motility associated factor glycosyltransferase family protein [Campylobacter jejuni]
MGLMMTFTPTQKELFNKNIEALSNILLKESLKEIKSSKFELILGKDNLDINLKDTSDNTFLYENVIDEFNSMLNTYNDKYLLYPVLYFYGFGNGILYKALLQNKNHQHIVVFEKDIEIIWIMFHILDFSHELQNSRLMVLQTSSLDIEFFSNFCSSKPFFQFSRIYFLELMSHYYERFHEDILGLNKKLAENFKNSIVSHGNDPLDALQGIEQFVYNLPQMITHPSYKELLSKRKGISDTAIIVSTGPSLTKQLPLLKKYANKATIFCADSSYPILAKHGIKPDYVCMLERDEIVAECFNNDFGEFDKDIVFIVKSVTHPHTIKYLQKNNRAFILVSTYASFIQYLKLDYFGYFNMGFSVAHMNFLLTIHLKYKNIILIGQDLAYAKDGQTHSQGFIHANLHNGDYERDLDRFSTTAYGGNGKVQSSEIWTLFRHNFEKDIVNIKMNYHITTYNCTEGGARIEGTIEKPFLWACENLLDKDLNKPFDFPKFLDKKLAKEKLEKTKKYLQKSILESKEFIKKTQTQLQKLRYTLEKNDKNFQTLEKIKNNLLNLFKEFKKLKLFNELCQAIYFHNECEILKFEVLNTNKQKENLIDFLKIQHNWFIQGLGYLDTQNQTIEKSLENWNFDDIIKK